MLLYVGIAFWSLFSIVVSVKTWKGLNKIDKTLSDWESTLHDWRSKRDPR